MQVLDRQQQRGVAAERLEQRQQRLVDARLAGLVVGGAVVARQQRREPGARGGVELGEDRIAVAREGAQSGDERRIGQLALTELDALADQDPRAGGGRAVGELGQQSRLADA